ncbi:MAG: hypothetical protein JY451_15170 [Erythrobacter sp.]|nr:MAG: hypothetical protein JY451_15170 [Erythrobacter sp.]
MAVGDRVTKRGFFTKALYLRSQPSHELEQRLGYRTGRLSQGWSLLFMDDMLTETDFEFRGYSQMSGGVAQGHLPNPPDPRNSEQWLRDNNFDLPRLKQKIIREVFAYTGHERLAKVVPLAGEFGEDDYPPGSGIPQWTIVRPKGVQFRVAAEIGPGMVYLGNYT